MTRTVYVLIDVKKMMHCNICLVSYICIIIVFIGNTCQAPKTTVAYVNVDGDVILHTVPFVRHDKR